MLRTGAKPDDYRLFVSCSGRRASGLPLFPAAAPAQRMTPASRFGVVICFVTYHCCAIEKRYGSQYSTRPAGKKKNITPKISGINIIRRACTGSGGVGFSLY